MEVKMIEVRDRDTFIPMMAVRVSSRTEKERFLLSRAGYGLDGGHSHPYVLLIECQGEYGMAACSFYHWGGRTKTNAHQYLIENWNLIESGDVIDVEYILGETLHKKLSESTYAVD